MCQPKWKWPSSTLASSITSRGAVWRGNDSLIHPIYLACANGHALEVARTLSSTLEAPELLARVNRMTRQQLGADWTATFLVDKQRRNKHPRTHRRSRVR